MLHVHAYSRLYLSHAANPLSIPHNQLTPCARARESCIIRALLHLVYFGANKFPRESEKGGPLRCDPLAETRREMLTLGRVTGGFFLSRYRRRKGEQRGDSRLRI